MPMDLKAMQKEISFDTKIELLLLPIFILSATPFSAFTLHPQNNSTASRKLFPVVISSIEDLSDDGGLQKYYPFNRVQRKYTHPVCTWFTISSGVHT